MLPTPSQVAARTRSSGGAQGPLCHDNLHPGTTGSGSLLAVGDHRGRLQKQDWSPTGRRAPTQVLECWPVLEAEAPMRHWDNEQTARARQEARPHIRYRKANIKELRAVSHTGAMWVTETVLYLVSVWQQSPHHILAVYPLCQAVPSTICCRP